MENCKHNWVYRKDGYVEQCVPAICTKCGKYGCFCDFKFSNSEIYYKEGDEGKKNLYLKFMENGINGDSHYIENKMKEIEEKNNEFSRFEIMDI